MKGARLMLLAALAGLSFTALVDTGLAKDSWDRDRDRRSPGVIAGTVAAEVAAGAARANAREDYEECMAAYAFEDRYDRYCREQYYYDRAEARRAGRRAGVVVGLGVREIVRD